MSFHAHQSNWKRSANKQIKFDSHSIQPKNQHFDQQCATIKVFLCVIFSFVFLFTRLCFILCHREMEINQWTNTDERTIFQPKHTHIETRNKNLENAKKNRLKETCSKSNEKNAIWVHKLPMKTQHRHQWQWAWWRDDIVTRRCSSN